MPCCQRRFTSLGSAGIGDGGSNALMQAILSTSKCRSKMQRAIIAFHQDADGHWVAELDCEHFQHVRHEPAWMLRPWVLTEEGRASMIGRPLECKKCDAGDPPDRQTPT